MPIAQMLARLLAMSGRFGPAIARGARAAWPYAKEGGKVLHAGGGKLLRGAERLGSASMGPMMGLQIYESMRGGGGAPPEMPMGPGPDEMDDLLAQIRNGRRAW